MMPVIKAWLSFRRYSIEFKNKKERKKSNNLDFVIPPLLICFFYFLPFLFTVERNVRFLKNFAQHIGGK